MSFLTYTNNNYHLLLNTLRYVLKIVNLIMISSFADLFVECHFVLIVFSKIGRKYDNVKVFKKFYYEEADRDSK